MTAASQKTTGVRMCKIRLEQVHAKSDVSAAGPIYEFIAPLDATGHINAEDWRRERALCFVHKIEGGDIVQRGLLVHRPGGAGGGTWQFDYALGEGEEDTGFRFDTHSFVESDYVSISDAEGDLRTYRIASVKPT